MQAQRSRRPASPLLPCLQAKEGVTPTAALDASAAPGAEPAFSPAPVLGPPAKAVAPAAAATAMQGTQTLAEAGPTPPEPAQQTEAGSAAAVREAAVDAVVRTAEAAQQTEPAGADAGGCAARTAEAAQQTEPAGGAAISAAANEADAAQAAEELAQSMEDLQEDLSSVQVGLCSHMHC